MTSSAVSTRSHRTSLFMMLGSAACFITNVLLIRALAGVENVSLWVVTSARFAVGLAIVCTLYRREFQPSHLFTNRKLIERGLLGGLCTLGFYYTVTTLGAGRATFINNTYVIWGGLFAVWVLREHLRPALLTGAVTTLLGLGLLTNPFATGAHTGFDDFIALLNALGAAWIVVTIRQLHAREHSSTIFAAQCVYGLLLCGLPALGGLHMLTAAAWGVLLLASVCAGAGQLLMTHAFRDLGVAEGSLLQMLVPLGIALGGMAFFGEHFTAVELAGGGLILAGTAAPGYPACPDHRHKPQIWNLVPVEKEIGITLTESCAMYPASSVSGFYFNHPDSKYFAVGKLGRDQLADYATRTDVPLADHEKWLGPYLDYDPS